MKGASRARLWLVLYLAAVVAITFVHNPVVLGSALCLAVAAAGKARWQVLRRTLLAIIAFNLTISLGYVIITLWQENFNPHYLVLINLRVLLLVFLGFWFVRTIDILVALKGWPLASLIATLAIGQIKTFERVLHDFRLSFESRNLVRPRMIDKARCAGAQTQTLLDKSMVSAHEAAQAMRSRGAFDD